MDVKKQQGSIEGIISAGIIPFEHRGTFFFLKYNWVIEYFIC